METILLLGIPIGKTKDWPNVKTLELHVKTIGEQFASQLPQAWVIFKPIEGEFPTIEGLMCVHNDRELETCLNAFFDNGFVPPLIKPNKENGEEVVKIETTDEFQVKQINAIDKAKEILNKLRK